ncbi:MAG TPA: hypothetical protein VFG84_06880 [Gemmatimonadaceae bacterium]|nr:hypothetical protein [Gemmatimonadaceae bacterium]
MRVYVNAVPVDAEDGQTALDAVRLFDAATADDVEGGSTIITDSRGLPAPPSTPLHGGAIFRLVPARHRDADSAAEGD